MYDVEGNRSVVSITYKEVKANWTEETDTGWDVELKAYGCSDGPVNALKDGSFQVVSTGTLIYPKSKLPKTGD